MLKRSDIETTGLPRVLRGKVTAARAGLLWERLWPALWPLLGLAALFLITALAGLWHGLPVWSQASGLALFAIAALAALWPVARVRLPTAAEGLDRLERDSALPHRPATAWLDRLAGRAEPSPASAETAQLWQAHRARAEAMLAALRPRPPRSGLARRDSWCLRVALTMALIIAAGAAGPDWPQRLASPFAFGHVTAASVVVDAWVSPPAYTGRPPVYLPAPTGDGAGGVVEVPAGSVLTVRVHGAPGAELSLASVGGGEGAPLAGEPVAGEDTVRQFRETLAHSSLATLRAGRTELRAWRVAVIPDRAPEIALSGDPEVAVSGALGLSYTVRDDYGVTQAGASFSRIEEDAPAGGAPSAAEEPLVPAPDFALSLPQFRAREGEGKTYKDLLAHPWAGAQARLVLRAIDEAGQVGESRPVEVTLPERRFNEPLARALVEQRRILAMTPSKRRQVTRALEALTIAPVRYIEDMTVYLGIRAAYWRLQRRDDREEMRSVVDLLWDLALRIEDGDLSLAARELRAAQEALEQALARDAGEEEIARLMDELRQALERYLNALAQQAREQNQAMPQPVDPRLQAIRPQDLSRMLDAIENMARSGAREQARQLLSQMREIMENLRAGRPQPPSAAQEEMQRALRELSEMIARQQQLMDQTFQLDNQGTGGKEDEARAGELGEGQSELRRRLQQLIERLQAEGGQPAGQLGQAERNMGQAGRELREGNPGAAVPQQGEALDNLRQGAEALQQALSRGRNQPGSFAGEQPVDPLGRPLPSRGADLGSRVKVPDQIDVETAREILQELRRRLGEPQRPRPELDYLDRLLRPY